MSAGRTEAESVDHYLRLAFWAYLLLTLFDGALRKWFLPFLASPLLILRDVLAVAICLYAIWRRRFHWNRYVLATISIVIIGIAYSVTLGHGNVFITFYGARVYLFHFPLIFVFAGVLRYEDLLRVERFMLYLAIPTIVLIVLQFYTPQSSIWNRGVGGDIAGSGFSGALGKYRPASWFAFTSGNIEHLGITACFVVSAWLRKQRPNLLVLGGATLAILIAAPLSISRGYIVQLTLTVLFASVAGFTSAKYIRTFSVALVTTVVLFAGLSQLEFFQESIEVISTRFTQASVAEGGIESTVVNRVLAEKLNAFDPDLKTGFFGAGLGVTTNFGAIVLSGVAGFLYSEDEWGRITDELGILLGSGIIAARLLLAFDLLYGGWRRLRQGKPLAWILMSFGFLFVVSAQVGTPTTLGFFVITASLAYAAVHSAPARATTR